MNIIKLGFLASHGGSNMQAIIDACNSKKLNMIPSVIISNNSKSKALQRADEENIPGYHLSTKTETSDELLDNKITEVLKLHKVDLVILAGYMKKLGDSTLKHFKNRILNIHPALLPNYGGKGMYGMNVHNAIIQNKEKETGITLHLVDGDYDHGKIINQIKLPVLENDTPESLQNRVLNHEHKFYVDTLKLIETEEIKL